MKDWLSNHPEIQNVTTLLADLNGQARGKRMPTSLADKAFDGTARMPLSVVNLDIRGHDVYDSPLIYETGDRDGILHPTERGPIPAPWLTSTALLPVSMHDENDTPYGGDPRNALGLTLERYKSKGWNVVAATELEFYLVDDSGNTLRPPVSPRSGKRLESGEYVSLHALDEFEHFFTDLYSGCEAMDIPADTVISEAGVGQFEINLMHCDAMRAADDAWFFKQLVKGLARKHGFAATFMAKPFADQPGNGMHVHFSVVDEAGENIFNDGTDRGSDTLLHAVAGCARAMIPSALILAPHGNSYDRLAPYSHAPTGVTWAYENRTAAIRIPAGAPAARRIEHRVAGGDVNPYLMLATVLGAAMNGIEDRLAPPEPLEGNAYESDAETLPDSWGSAIDAFGSSEEIKRILPKELIENLIFVKKQDLATYAKLDEAERARLYLEAV